MRLPMLHPISGGAKPVLYIQLPHHPLKNGAACEAPLSMSFVSHMRVAPGSAAASDGARGLAILQV